MARRFLIVLIALISLVLNFILFIRIEKISNEITIDNLISHNEKNFNFPEGIYLVYPLDGSACSSCIYSICDSLTEFSKNKKVWILLPEGNIRLSSGFEKMGKVIRYKRVNKFARKKVFFIGKDGKILFCIDLGLLIESPRKTLKSFGYTFRYLI